MALFSVPVMMREERMSLAISRGGPTRNQSTNRTDTCQPFDGKTASQLRRHAAIGGPEEPQPGVTRGIAVHDRADRGVGGRCKRQHIGAAHYKFRSGFAACW